MNKLEKVILLLPGLNQTQEIKHKTTHKVTDEMTLVYKRTHVEKSNFQHIFKWELADLAKLAYNLWSTVREGSFRLSDLKSRMTIYPSNRHTWSPVETHGGYISDGAMSDGFYGGRATAEARQSNTAAHIFF